MKKFLNMLRETVPKHFWRSVHQDLFPFRLLLFTQGFWMFIGGCCGLFLGSFGLRQVGCLGFGLRYFEYDTVFESGAFGRISQGWDYSGRDDMFGWVYDTVASMFSAAGLIDNSRSGDFSTRSYSYRANRDVTSEGLFTSVFPVSDPGEISFDFLRTSEAPVKEFFFLRVFWGWLEKPISSWSLRRTQTHR